MQIVGNHYMGYKHYIISQSRLLHRRRYLNIIRIPADKGKMEKSSK